MKGPEQLTRAGIPRSRVARGTDAGRLLHLRSRDDHVFVNQRRRGEPERGVSEPVESSGLHVHDALVAEAWYKFARVGVQSDEFAAGSAEVNRRWRKPVCGAILETACGGVSFGQLVGPNFFAGFGI